VTAKHVKWVLLALLFAFVMLEVAAFSLQNSQLVELSWNMGFVEFYASRPWPVSTLVLLSGVVGVLLGRIWGWFAGARKERVARAAERDRALGTSADDDWV
jgi:uncharacterized integral membrane protein